MSPELKNSCEGIEAPDGWKFQDCSDDLISLLRQKRRKWTENDWRNRKPKDDYILTQLYDDPDEWEIHLYDRDDTTFGDYESGQIQLIKEDAAKETVCMAIAHDVWLSSSARGDMGIAIMVSARALDKCRDNMGI